MPTPSGGRALVCSAHRSDARAWRWQSACSLESRLSLHVACGMYMPGNRGSKSWVERPNTHMAGVLDLVCFYIVE